MQDNLTENFDIDRQHRTKSLEKKLVNLQRREIDKEIAKRLKYSQGTVDAFLEKDQLDLLVASTENSHISDTYILASIDPTGNLGSKRCSPRNGTKEASEDEPPRKEVKLCNAERPITRKSTSKSKESIPMIP